MVKTSNRDILNNHARRIAQYWARRGALVNVDIVRDDGQGEPTYSLRSDMVNGLPRNASRDFVRRLKDEGRTHAGR